MQIKKPILSYDKSVKESLLYKSKTLYTSSVGLSSVNYVYNSSKLSGSYWDSLHVLFYLSGSPVISASRPQDIEKFSISQFKYRYHRQNPMHLNKFVQHTNGELTYKSGSVISIAQQHFGEEIKPKSFKLVDNSTICTMSIRDDGYGNLYPIGNTLSASTNSPSSSDNYIGNIFYDSGLVTLTTTESYSASCPYSDVTTGNYQVYFSSSHAVYSQEYLLNVSPKDFLQTTNITARGLVPGSSNPWGKEHIHSPVIDAKFRPSISQSWAPYATAICLWQDDEVVIVGQLKQPIKMRKDVTLNFKIRIDVP